MLNRLTRSTRDLARKTPAAAHTSIIVVACSLAAGGHPTGWAQGPSAVVLNGFVTEATSGSIGLGPVEVRLNETTRCLGYDEAAAAYTFDRVIRQVSRPCKSMQLQTGEYVQVQGVRIDTKTVSADVLTIRDPWRVGPIHPSRWSFLRVRPALRAFSVQSGGVRNGTMSGASFLEEPASPENVSSKSRSLWVNGFPLELTNLTSVRLATRTLGLGEMFHFVIYNFGIVPAQPHISGTLPLSTHAETVLLPGTFVAYEASAKPNGLVNATHLTVFPNLSLFSQARDNQRSAVKVSEQAVNSHSNTPADDSPIPVLSDQEVQKYVQRLGGEVIPAYLRNARTPEEVRDIHFTVVKPFTNALHHDFMQVNGAVSQVILSEWKSDRRSPLSLSPTNGTVNDIVEGPDGSILVPDTVLARLSNRAQLSFCLAAAAATYLQKLHAISAAAMNVKPGASATPLAGIEYIENMIAMRSAIRQMYLAGYDMREGPYAWAAAKGAGVANPVRDTDDPDEVIPWYAAYGFNYIRQYYSDVDYSKLKRGEAEYQQFLQHLREVDPAAFTNVAQTK